MGDAPTPLPLRPSESERERALSVLRASSVQGRLSLETFSGRVERAYGARSRAELDELVGDLPERRRVARLLSRATAALSALTAELEVAWREPRTPRLALPRAGTIVTIGRGSGCDCVLADDSVSRRHARLRQADDAWLLADLGSTNGTRLNGWRVGQEVEVRAGDRVAFGSARFRLTHP